MADKKYVARLIKGRSYTIQGKRYVPETDYEVTSEEEFNLLVRSGHFELSTGDEKKPLKYEGKPSEEESETSEPETEGESPSKSSPKKKKHR